MESIQLVTLNALGNSAWTAGGMGNDSCVPGQGPEQRNNPANQSPT